MGQGGRKKGINREKQQRSRVKLNPKSYMLKREFRQAYILHITLLSREVILVSHPPSRTPCSLGSACKARDLHILLIRSNYTMLHVLGQEPKASSYRMPSRLYTSHQFGTRKWGNHFTIPPLTVVPKSRHILQLLTRRCPHLSTEISF